MALPTQPCKGCGAPVVWIRTERGRSAPCDPIAVTVITLGGESVRGYTSHFATCPQAARFRKTKTAPADTPPEDETA